MLPIHFACKGGNSTGMLYLINSGSSVDAVDNVNKPLYFHYTRSCDYFTSTYRLGIRLSIWLARLIVLIGEFFKRNAL